MASETRWQLVRFWNISRRISLSKRMGYLISKGETYVKQNRRQGKTYGTRKSPNARNDIVWTTKNVVIFLYFYRAF